MITDNDLQNRGAGYLTPRQAEALEHVERYTQVAGEPPSASWLARRLKVSRQSALDLAARARERRARVAARL